VEVTAIVEAPFTTAKLSVTEDIREWMWFGQNLRRLFGEWHS